MSKDNGPFIILGDDRPSNSIPIETFSIEKQKEQLLTAGMGDDVYTTTRNILAETKGWLPFFSEVYNISADINDYILVPVSPFLSGIPNKKGHAFTVEELTSPDTDSGKLRYETFDRQPLHEDHKNGDYGIARGAILASSMLPAPEFHGDVYRVTCLQAFDRRTYPSLARKILAGEINSYSMGAKASAFECSVCKESIPGPCDHIPQGMIQGSGFSQFPRHNGKLGCLNARGVRFFEISALNRNNPAWAGATNTPKDLMTFRR